MSLPKSVMCVLFAISALALVPASAEDAPPAPEGGAKQGGGQGGGGQGGGRGNFDPEQFKQRMLERMKENLGVTDEEMKALQPKIEAVQKLQAQVRGGNRGFGGGGMQRRRGGNNGGNGGGDATPAAPAASTEPKSESEKKTQELQALVDNKENSDAKAIKAKLQEVREIREKARGDLKKAQDELRELLTPKQEAQLVLMGILE